MQPPCRSSPSTFHSDELGRALREQAFGISCFTVAPATSRLHATAYVTLLEGAKITVTLSNRGYQVDAYEGGDTRVLAVKTEGKIFETVEQLLQAASALYERKQQEVLVNRLSNLS